MIYFWVALGGAIGTLARFSLSSLISHSFGDVFPWGTLVINITGSFLIGFFEGLTSPGGVLMVSGELRTFFMVGLCGGYTTFSSYSLQTLRLAQSGEYLYAGTNFLASNISCLVAVWLGHVCATALRR